MKTHITVLRNEAVKALAIKKAHVVVDATLGSCGHSSEIIGQLGKSGVFIGIDADPRAIELAPEKLPKGTCAIHLRVGNFKDIDSILEKLGITQVDAILADLGWRMEQFGGNGKGFSFQSDEPLVMTYGDPKEYPFTARDIVNDWKEQDIANVLKGYGEEKFARKIAQAIVLKREESPIETTHELVSLIEQTVPAFYKHGKIHCATRTFQALRIAVNDEFEVLEIFIKKAIEYLSDGGKLAIITFHSTEDRIVKHLFRQLAHDHIGYVCTKKPMQPTPEEISSNPRARSAKLRVFEKHEEV